MNVCSGYSSLIGVVFAGDKFELALFRSIVRRGGDVETNGSYILLHYGEYVFKTQ